VKIDKQEAIPQTSVGRKQQRRYTNENEKVTARLNEQVTGPQKSRGKNKEDNSNLPPTEDKTAFAASLASYRDSLHTTRLHKLCFSTQALNGYK